MQALLEPRELGFLGSGTDEHEHWQPVHAAGF